FATVLKEYGVFTVVGDKYAGETFIADFEAHGIAYDVSNLTKSDLYEGMEPHLNAGKVVLLDESKLESQFLGLIWKSGKIDHSNGEHDDYANAAAGAIHLASQGVGDDDYAACGERVNAYRELDVDDDYPDYRDRARRFNW